MDTITKNRIRTMTERLHKRTGIPLDLSIHNPGDGTIYQLSVAGPNHTIERTLSPSLKARQMYDWIWAFIDGYECYKRQDGGIFCDKCRAKTSAVWHYNARPEVKLSTVPEFEKDRLIDLTLFKLCGDCWDILDEQNKGENNND